MKSGGIQVFGGDAPLLSSVISQFGRIERYDQNRSQCQSPFEGKIIVLIHLHLPQSGLARRGSSSATRGDTPGAYHGYLAYQSTVISKKCGEIQIEIARCI